MLFEVSRDVVHELGLLCPVATTDPQRSKDLGSRIKGLAPLTIGP